MRLECTVADAAEVAARVRATVPPPASVADEVAGIVHGVREGGDVALAGYEARFGSETPRARAGAMSSRRRSRRSIRPSATGLKTASGTCARWRKRGSMPRPRWRCREGQTVRLREVPVRRAAVYAPGGRHPYPSSVVMGAVTARAAGVDEVVRRGARPPGHPRRRGAVRGRRGVPDGRRAGGRGARLRHRDDPAGRRDRRPRQPVGAGGEAAGLGRGRHRRLRRPERPDDHRLAGRRPRAAAPGPDGAGRARRGLAGGRRERRRRRC